MKLNLSIIGPHEHYLLARAKYHQQHDTAAGFARWVSHLPTADAIRVLRGLPAPSRHDLIPLLRHRAAVRAIQKSPAALRTELLGGLTDRDAARLIADVPGDEAVAVLELMSRSRREEILVLLPDQIGERYRTLLAYPRTAIGRYMTRRVPLLRAAATVAETRDHLRAHRDEYVNIDALVIVDELERVQGTVPLNRLVLAADEDLLSTLTEPLTVPVKPNANAAEVVQLFAAYNWLMLPVVDADNHFVGAVTVEDIVDITSTTHTREILHLGGVSSPGRSTSYWAGSIVATVRQRFSWIILLFLAETLTGSVLRSFQSEIEAVVALSFFIPLVLSTGGNTGSQSVTTIIRGLALGEISLTDWWRAARREVITGLLLGAALALVGYVRVLVWGQPMRVAGTVALTIVAVTIWANAVGALVPIVASRFRQDPTVLSAPFIATFVDATGLLIYFMIAKVVLGLH